MGFECLPNLNPSKGVKSLPNNSERSTNYAQVAPSPLVNQLQSISARPFSSYCCCFPIHTDQSNRKRRRLLETEKLHVSLTTSIPFSSTPSDKEKPLSTWGKLKQMVKDYWYIIIPVEVATSIFWYSAFYLTLQSGFDIIALLESMGASEATLAISSVVVARLESTRPGYLRTSSQLAQEGKERGKEGVDYVKAKSEDARERYEERRDDLRERYEDAKERYEDRREEMKDDIKERMERLNKLYQGMKKR